MDKRDKEVARRALRARARATERGQKTTPKPPEGSRSVRPVMDGETMFHYIAERVEASRTYIQEFMLAIMSKGCNLHMTPNSAAVYVNIGFGGIGWPTAQLVIAWSDVELFSEEKQRADAKRAAEEALNQIFRGEIPK